MIAFMIMAYIKMFFNIYMFMSSCNHFVAIITKSVSIFIHIISKTVVLVQCPSRPINLVSFVFSQLT